MALLLGACASTPRQLQYSGFLSDYSRLYALADDPSAMGWVDPAANFASYDKLLLERIQVTLDEDAGSVDPTEIAALTDYFRKAIAGEFDPPYPLVNEPGPGVLRARIAITDLKPTNPGASVVMTAVPFASVGEMALGAVAGSSDPLDYLGDTGIEAEFIDASTGQVVAQFVDEQAGRKVVINFDEGVGGAVTEGVTGFTGAYSTWAYARQAFDHWAERFRQRFDELRQAG